VSVHATCTVVFVIVAVVICITFSSIRTLDRVSWLGWVGMVSILAAVITLMASVGTQDRPADAPAEGDWNKEVNVVPKTNFVDAMNAVTTVVFAYCATPAFMSIVGEMKRPQDYNRSIVASQTFITMLYLVVGGVVYHYVGQYIASPVSCSSEHCSSSSKDRSEWYLTYRHLARPDR
jgi:amino acid permease